MYYFDECFWEPDRLFKERRIESFDLYIEL